MTSSPSSSSVTSQALIDLFRPRLIVFSKFFQVFVHLLYNSALLLDILTFVLVTCCSQLDVYVLSFWSTGSTFNSSKISSFLLWSKSVYPAVLLKNFISIYVNRLLSFCMRAQISLSCRRMRTASALYTFIVEDFWSKIGLKLFFRISNMWEIFFSIFCRISFFIFIATFTTEIFKIIYFL